MLSPPRRCRTRRCPPRRLAFLLATAALGAFLPQIVGCAAGTGSRNPLAYTPDEFQAALREKAPNLGDRLTTPPFAIDAAFIERANKTIQNAPRGPERVQALVEFLTAPEPHGLGLRYDWSFTAGARDTIEQRRGNCFALASVLVGLGRGVGWPIYYAEARPRRPETMEFEEVTALSDHMVVLVVAKTVHMVVDFTGEVSPETFDLRPIDDLTAFAHLWNNVAGQSVMISEDQDKLPNWENALSGFLLATQVQPKLGRAWNNLGIAYTRLGRFEEAREAYRRALELDTAFGSAERNLSLMETRQKGKPTLIPEGPIDSSRLSFPYD